MASSFVVGHLLNCSAREAASNTTASKQRVNKWGIKLALGNSTILPICLTELSSQIIPQAEPNSEAESLLTVHL